MVQGWSPCEELGRVKNFISSTMYTWHGEKALISAAEGYPSWDPWPVSCSLWREQA